MRSLKSSAVPSHSARSEPAAETACSAFSTWRDRSTGAPGALQLDHEPALRRPVQEPVERRAPRADVAADRDRDAVEPVAQVRADAPGEVARDGVEAAAEHPFAQAQELGRVGARLDDGVVGLADHQQRPVRLDRAREVDLLALAVREVRLAEGGHGHRGPGSDGHDRKPRAQPLPSGAGSAPSGP